MKTRALHLCLASAPLTDPELLATYAVLLAVLVLGGVAINVTYRWYRNLRQASSSRNDDLNQLARTLEDEDELDPAERDRVRAALERQQEAGGQDKSKS